MFNAYFLRRGYHFSMVGDVVAWVDSGGFLFLDAPQRRLAGLHGVGRGGALPSSGWSEDLVAEVLERQERFGASVAFTLDYPLPAESQLDPGCCPGEVYRRLRATAAAAGIAYQLRSRRSMKILVVLQYNGTEALRVLLHMLRRELRERAGIGLDEVDGYAVGGLVPHSAKWWLITRRLQEARRLLGWSAWIHLLGVASPHNIALFYQAGADSMDSKTYIIAAAKRLYYQPPGTKPARIDLRRTNGDKPSCQCPACQAAETMEALRNNTKLLALHNLHVTLAAGREATRLYEEEKLWETLRERAKQSPRLRKALREITTPRQSQPHPILA